MRYEYDFIEELCELEENAQKNGVLLEDMITAYELRAMALSETREKYDG